MCGEMGKAVLSALTTVVLYGFVSHAAYLQVFEAGIGTFNKCEIKLEVEAGARPVWRRARPVPHALRPAVEAELARLQAEGIVSPVEWSDWGTPVVPVIKKNGQRYQPYELQYEQAVIRKPLREHEKPQDLRNVPGTPGVEYPIYHEVPDTSFSCAHVPVHPGMYANVETGCQAYHVCHDGREGHQGASFLCTNGTLFDQAKFACDWWYNVDCSQAIAHYKLNADPLKNPYVPKPKPEQHLEEVISHHHQHQPQSHLPQRYPLRQAVYYKNYRD